MIKRIRILFLVLLISLGGSYWLTQQQVSNISFPTALPPTQTPSTNPPTGSRLLEVHFIDVGQGDGILLRTPDGYSALIDGGEENGLALNYLRQQGITELDAVMVSHPHADHIGGLIAILNEIKVKGVWTSGAIHTTYVYERLIDTIAEQAIPYYEVQTDDSIPAGELAFAVLHSSSNESNLNNTSLVLRIQYGSVSFLFTGDAELPVENRLLATSVELLPSSVLKVGHHGSQTSSSRAFIQAVHPVIAVYSASQNNQYGHPHRSTLEILGEVGAAVYGTDIHGTVVISTDGASIHVQTVGNEVLVNFDDLGQPTPSTTQFASVTAEQPFEFDPFGSDRDCGHYDTHEEAQAFFIAAGGPDRDPHRLDGDNDGIACESLP